MIFGPNIGLKINFQLFLENSLSYTPLTLDPRAQGLQPPIVSDGTAADYGNAPKNEQCGGLHKKNMEIASPKAFAT